MSAFINLALSVASFVFGFVVMARDAEWWVPLILLAFGALTLAIALYKLNEETEFLAKWRARLNSKRSAKALPYKRGDLQGAASYCAKLSPAALKRYAKPRYRKVWSFVRTLKDVSEETADIMLSGSVLTCLALEGGLTEREWRFISDFLPEKYTHSYSEAQHIALEFHDSEAQKITAEFASVLPADLGVEFAELCIAALASDGRVSSTELAFLKRFFLKAHLESASQNG